MAQLEGLRPLSSGASMTLRARCLMAAVAGAGCSSLRARSGDLLTRLPTCHPQNSSESDSSDEWTPQSSRHSATISLSGTDPVKRGRCGVDWDMEWRSAAPVERRADSEWLRATETTRHRAAGAHTQHTYHVCMYTQQHALYHIFLQISPSPARASDLPLFPASLSAAPRARTPATWCARGTQT